MLASTKTATKTTSRVVLTQVKRQYATAGGHDRLTDLRKAATTEPAVKRVDMKREKKDVYKARRVSRFRTNNADGRYNNRGNNNRRRRNGSSDVAGAGGRDSNQPQFEQGSDFPTETEVEAWLDQASDGSDDQVFKKLAGFLKVEPGQVSKKIQDGKVREVWEEFQISQQLDNESLDKEEDLDNLIDNEAYQLLLDEEHLKYVERKRYQTAYKPVKPISNKSLKVQYEALDQARQFNSFVKGDNTLGSKISSTASTTRYTPSFTTKPELEIVKAKAGYDTKSRFLRALEQLTKQKGYVLSDTFRRHPNLPATTQGNYPFGQTNLPNSGPRSNSSPLEKLAGQLKGDSKNWNEIMDSTVRGVRSEVVLNAADKKRFGTEQLKLNASVVANALNSNAQLKVTDLHLQIAGVAASGGSLKDIPRVLEAKK
ncbi:unnamed protein product [Ambrosiozyma monospora]|uniref:Unnamed protein product n=1 Tax=Ambrosiozyma monospora TaxID=43982 RepID=A0A9W6YZ24_AMBMO|nr:unnamed protein product [Ambrosiozyma monospora]